MVRVHASLGDGSQFNRLRHLLADVEAAFDGEGSAAALGRLELARADEGSRRQVFEACERLSRLNGLFPELEASEGPLLRVAREFFSSGSLAAHEA
jgi:hypothetical protein